jgi:hypothetical protein
MGVPPPSGSTGTDAEVLLTPRGYARRTLIGPAATSTFTSL